MNVRAFAGLWFRLVRILGHVSMIVVLGGERRQWLFRNGTLAGSVGGAAIEHDKTTESNLGPMTDGTRVGYQNVPGSDRIK